MKISTILVLLTGLLVATSVQAAGSDSSSETAADSAYKIAEAAVKSKDYSRAAMLFSRVVKDDSSNANAWNYLAFSHRKLGKVDEAEMEYKKALILNPDHKGAHEYLGELYVETGRTALARQLLDRLKVICGTDCEEYEALQQVIDAGTS
jgi:Tfp pilus assembly protein PilF